MENRVGAIVVNFDVGELLRKLLESCIKGGAMNGKR